MAPHEIFARMSPATATQLLSFLFEKEKSLYKASVEALAKQRNVRSVYVERKPREERFTWLHNALSRAAGGAVGAHLLQVWLVAAHASLLCDFLDGLEIPHDENGTVEDLPASPPLEKIAPVVETLLGKYDQELVAIYLHAFQALDENGGWAPLEELLESDSRLHLKQTA